MSVIVVKYGGSLLEEPGHRSLFLKEAAALAGRAKLVLVHGGGKEISRQMEQAGLTPRFVNGRRYTDEAAMEVVEKALSRLNADIVTELGTYGAKAVGLSGRDQSLLIAEPIAELGRVGMPKTVNAAALQKFLKNAALPVFYSVAEDAEHAPLNINADEFALALAIACRSDQLVYLTDTGGVLDAAGKRITRITPADVDRLAKEQVITGGMLVKVRACVDALKKGVGRVDIVKGISYLLKPESLEPEGTVFTLT